MHRNLYLNTIIGDLTHMQRSDTVFSLQNMFHVKGKYGSFLKP
jgi:hypothetical protein